jgi:hypothetical protein
LEVVDDVDVRDTELPNRSRDSKTNPFKVMGDNNVWLLARENLEDASRGIRRKRVDDMPKKPFHNGLFIIIEQVIQIFWIKSVDRLRVSRGLNRVRRRLFTRRNNERVVTTLAQPLNGAHDDMLGSTADIGRIEI